MTEVREQVDDFALKLFAAWCGTTPEHAATRDAWTKGQQSLHTRNGWQRVAAAAREGDAQWLAAQGLAIVPKLPTRKMLDAAAKSMSPAHRPTPNRVSVSAKHGIRYQAMVNAAEVQ